MKEAGIQKKFKASVKYVHNGPKGGRLEQISYPSTEGGNANTVQYIYDDKSGLVEDIRLNSASVWRAADGAFTARNKPKHVSFGNRTASLYDYDQATGRLLGMNTQKAGASLIDYRLRYDTAGNVRQRQLTVAQGKGQKPLALGSAYSYDDKHQLISSGEGKGQGFTYKTNGSRTGFIEGKDETLYSYDPSAPHQISSLTGSQDRRFSYDRAGNMVQDVNAKSGYIRRFVWNSSNKLQQMAIGGSRQQISRYLCYGYGSDRKRVLMYDSLKNCLHLYIDDIAVAEVHYQGKSSRTVMLSHIMNNERRTATLEQDAGQTAKLYYYHRDLLNSVVLITGEKGEILGAPSYEVFGKVQTHNSTTGADFQPDILFTGHRADIVDYHGFHQFDFKARVYEPELGIFISPDEEIDRNNAAFGFNRYIYVNNNPASRWDPNGNQGLLHGWGEDEEDTKLDDFIKGVLSSFRLVWEYPSKVYPEIHGFNLLEAASDIFSRETKTPEFQSGIDQETIERAVSHLFPMTKYQSAQQNIVLNPLSVNQYPVIESSGKTVEEMIQQSRNKIALEEGRLTLFDPGYGEALKERIREEYESNTNATMFGKIGVFTEPKYFPGGGLDMEKTGIDYWFRGR